jgi:hypothetical protein
MLTRILLLPKPAPYFTHERREVGDCVLPSRGANNAYRIDSKIKKEPMGFSLKLNAFSYLQVAPGNTTPRPGGVHASM